MLNKGLVLRICFLLGFFSLYLSYLTWLGSPFLSTQSYILAGLGALLFLTSKDREGATGPYPADHIPLAGKEALLLLILLILAIYAFFAKYAAMGGFNDGEVYWAGWSDQAHYIKMAHAIYSLGLKAEDYYYGLGYPILGSIFVGVYPKDPFLIPNLLGYLATLSLTYLIAKRFLGGAFPFVAIILVMYSSPLTEYFVVPWSTTISTVSFLAVLYIALKNSAVSFFESALTGLALGLTFAARYVDLILLIPLALHIIFKNNFRTADRAKIFPLIAKPAVGLLIFLIMTGGVLSSHYYYFGSIFKSPYHLHGRPGTNLSDQDIKVYQPGVIMDHLFGQFINPNTFHAREMENIPKRLRTPLLERSFYFILAPLGIAYLMLRRRFSFLPPCLMGGILALIIYGMHPGTAPGCLQFHSLHYFKMWYPFLTIMSLVGLVQISNYFDVKGKEKVIEKEKGAVNKKGDKKNYLWILATIGIMALLSRFDVTFDADSQTIALWRFNKKGHLLLDKSRNLHHGYMIGTSLIKGSFEQGGFFDGTKSYVVIPNTDDLNPVKQFTIELWIYPMPIVSAEGAIFCKGWGNGGESFCIDLVKPKNDSYRFRFFIRGKKDVATGRSDPIIFNNWYYLACIYSGTSIEIYVNGVLIKTIPVQFEINTNSDDISIGARKPSAISPYGLFFRGIIKEIRFSSRARSQTEIHNYYKRYRRVSDIELYPYYLWGIITFWAMAILFTMNSLKRWVYR